MTNEEFNSLNRAQTINLLRKLTPKLNKRLTSLEKYEEKTGIKSPAYRSASNSTFLKMVDNKPRFFIPRNLNKLPLQNLKEKLAHALRWEEQKTSTIKGLKELREERYKAFINNTDESLHQYITKDSANAYFEEIEEQIEKNPQYSVVLYGHYKDSVQTNVDIKEIYFRNQGVLSKDEISKKISQKLEEAYKRGV